VGVLDAHEFQLKHVLHAQPTSNHLTEKHAPTLASQTTHPRKARFRLVDKLVASDRDPTPTTEAQLVGDLFSRMVSTSMATLETVFLPTVEILDDISIS
jgi:hypothetical protein